MYPFLHFVAFALRLGFLLPLLTQRSTLGLDETAWSPSRCLLDDVPESWCRRFPDGRFPLTVFGGSCQCFVRCSGDKVVDKRACWLSYVFNPLLQKCDYYANVSSDLYLFDSCSVLNIGHSPSCFNKSDGFYPDNLGRCNMYYQCMQRNFFQWHRCPPNLVFNSLSSRCEDARLVPRDRFPRCGQGPSCRDKADGLYTDLTGLCHRFFACRDQLFQSFYTCTTPGDVFNPLGSKCQPRSGVPKEAYPPSMGHCTSGLPDCWQRSDGFYPDEKGRCHVFFECKAQNFKKWHVCPDGAFFNPQKQRCDDKYSIPQGSYGGGYEGRGAAVSGLGGGAGTYAGNDAGDFAVGGVGRSGVAIDAAAGVFPRSVDTDPFFPGPQKFPSLKSKCETAPSCVGKTNGNYAHKERNCEWFFTFRNETFLGFSRCAGFMRGPVFDERTNRCANPNDVPAPCGRFSEDTACKERIDGSYPARYRGCTAYFRCARGKFLGYSECTSGFVFNRHLLKCESPDKTPPPCGHFEDDFQPTN